MRLPIYRNPEIGWTAKEGEVSSHISSHQFTIPAGIFERIKAKVEE
jgi:hypothetical protein